MAVFSQTLSVAVSGDSRPWIEAYYELKELISRPSGLVSGVRAPLRDHLLVDVVLKEAHRLEDPEHQALVHPFRE